MLCTGLRYACDPFDGQSEGTTHPRGPKRLEAIVGPPRKRRSLTCSVRALGMPLTHLHELLQVAVLRELSTWI